jgi:hypothetical protein
MRHLLWLLFLSPTIFWAQTQPAMTVNNAGVFTNTQMNDYVTSLVGGTTTTTEFQRVFTSSNATEAIAGASLIPATSSVFQNNTVAGYTANSSTSTAGVSLYGQCYSLLANSRCWGLNTVAESTPGQPLTLGFYSAELDTNVYNTADVPVGLLLEGHWTQQASYGVALQIGTLQNCCHWPMGMRFETGATTTVNSSGAALWFQPVASGTNQVSQGIEFAANDLTSGLNLVAVNETAAGDLQIVNSKSGTGLVGNNIPVVGSFTTTAATNDNVSLIGMTSSGHCELTPTNSAAAAGISSVYVSAKATNQITVTHTAISGWTFDVLCTPN